MFAGLRQGFGGQAGRAGRAISAHLFNCQGLAVYFYSGAFCASQRRLNLRVQNFGGNILP